MTADQIRAKILETVSENGGHLASSLGAVEIAMALAEVFDPASDRIVWDVGHQAYAWKILTGRGGSFSTLRRFGGISGFPNPAESPCDAAVAGHAGVAISVAEGYAAARDMRGTSENVVAVVGDSALVNGTSFEALNNCSAATSKVIVVLNDNGMSISKPAGSFSRFLGRLISGVRYNRVKAAAEKAGHAMKLTFLRSVYHGLESRIKSLFLGNRYFEQFGLRYIGPVDGHDLKALKAAFTVAKEDKRSVIVHVVTKKGKGFAPAEKSPTYWHGVGPFDIAKASSLRDAPGAKALTWSDAFGSALAERAAEDPRIVALTAGMTDGTGLAEFAARFKNRFFDVGIAEGHMVSFAAGLAAGGLRPVVAVYSTFLQRAVDHVMHDVAISSLPVVFCVDRAGVVGADGVTHQGLYDIAMLKAIPNLTICQPRDADDLGALLDEALGRDGPTLIRYPRGAVPGRMPPRPPRGGAKLAIFATGDEYPKACMLGDMFAADVVHARYIKPLDVSAVEAFRARGFKIASIENGSVSGGMGESIGADFRFGWPDEFVVHGDAESLEKAYAFDLESIASRLEGAGFERVSREVSNG